MPGLDTNSISEILIIIFIQITCLKSLTLLPKLTIHFIQSKSTELTNKDHVVLKI